MRSRRPDGVVLKDTEGWFPVFHDAEPLNECSALAALMTGSEVFVVFCIPRWRVRVRGKGEGGGEGRRGGRRRTSSKEI